MNNVDEMPQEYNLPGFICLGVLIAFIIYLSVLHIRRSKKIYQAREERNQERRRGK